MNGLFRAAIISSLTAFAYLIIGLIVVELVLAFVFGYGRENISFRKNTVNKNVSLQSMPYADLCEFGLCPKAGTWVAKKEALVGDTHQQAELIYLVEYTINNMLERFTPGSENLNSGIHVNIFGGSFAFGEGLDDNETLPFFVSQAIRRAQVRNFGFHGAGVARALRILEAGSAPTPAINILLTGPFHAHRADCVYDWVRSEFRYRVISSAAGESLELVGRCAEFPSQSRLLSISKYINDSPILGVFATARIIADYLSRSYTAEQIHLYQAMLDKFDKLSKASGSLPLVAYIPWGSLTEFWMSGFLSDPVVKFLIDAEIDHIILDHYQNTAFHIHQLDIHPGARANCTSAQLISKHLGASSVLDCANL